jgi:LAO/AO transport system kinase
MRFAEAVLAGDRLALSRLITQVENDTIEGQQALDALFPHTGKAHLIGVTGSPGTGKSSLVNQIARTMRHPQNGLEPKKVAIVAVDPTSPFTGGAVLGDRVRMRDLLGDPGVFIRSMASRGALGGLSKKTANVVQVLDAAGFDVVIIETVGAGQSEVDIAGLAHTTLVVEAPGLGDDIQAIKAGILEIADILVVNKADRSGVENTERALRNMLALGYSKRLQKENSDQVHWLPPVIKTIAVEGAGIEELVAEIEKHQQYLTASGERNQRDYERIKNQLETMIHTALLAQWQTQTSEAEMDKVLKDLCERTISPHIALKNLLKNG